jgi:hypothetical protein
MNSSLNKSNLRFELITTKLVVIHTNEIMDIESLDSTQNNSNLLFLNLKYEFILKFEFQFLVLT